MEYNFEIQHQLGMENKVAYALSRISPKIEFSAISFPIMEDMKLIQEQVGADPGLAKIKKEL